MWILPTLNRPEQCAEVIRRIRSREARSSVLVFKNGEEGNDDYYYEFSKAGLLPFSLHLHEENIGAIGALNYVFKKYPDEKFYGFIGDDEFLTEDSPDDWNKKLIEAAGDWNFSHGVDNLHGGQRAQGYLCIGGKLARAVGYLAIPECWHYFGLDDMWEMLAMSKACRNVCVPEVRIDHRHYFEKPERMDECYKVGASSRDVDQQHFFHWMRTKMPAVIERIQKAKQ